MAAGYSGTPLSKKLGIKPGHAVYAYQIPKEYFDWLHPLPSDVSFKSRLQGEVDFIHLFTGNKKQLEKEFTRLKKNLKKDGMLWVSWPKKASGVPTDLDENIIREIGLKEGLVDVKVCAVSDVWSGLKFVFRLNDRNK